MKPHYPKSNIGLFTYLKKVQISELYSLRKKQDENITSQNLHVTLLGRQSCFDPHCFKTMALNNQNKVSH
jgi:hypothetical protein